MRISPIGRAPVQPFKLAIVGAGPSGFYAASRLLNAIPSHPSTPSSPQIHIDIYDRLPTPHGLVRYGVAPDHPDVKNVENKFEQVSKDPRLRFFGNVHVVDHSPSVHAKQLSPYPHAIQLPLSVLSQYYTHILFSYGSSQGRPLGIPGSHPGQLSNVYTALDFVNWYNGHPAAHDPHIIEAQRGKGTHDLGIRFDRGKRHLTVVGAGNVALDVARIVLRSSTPFLEPSGTSSRPTSNKAAGLADLAETDVPEPVLAELARSKIQKVDIFARRGPAQLAFTNKEFREMMSLEGIGFVDTDKQLLAKAIREIGELGKNTEEKIKNGETTAEDAAATLGEVRVKKRLLSLLEKGSKTKLAPDMKSWGINFFQSPAEFLAKDQQQAPTTATTPPPPVHQVRWNVTSLDAGQQTQPSSSSPSHPWGNEPGASTPSALRSTGQSILTETDMIVSSVGYKSEPLWQPSVTSAPHPHVEETGATTGPSRPISTLPFDVKKSIVPNRGGRVMDSFGNIIPRVYVSGWLARGPVGVIASTMMDAYTVADTILYDFQNSSSSSSDSSPPSLFNQDISKHLESDSNRLVSFQDWHILDQQERKRGQKLGKLREKFRTVDEMLQVLK